MSYGVKYRAVHKAVTNTQETVFKIEILRSGYTGDVIDLVASNKMFKLQYEKLDPSEPLQNPIQKGRLDFELFVQGSTEENLLNDIFASDENTFQMALYQDDALIWKGAVLNDLVEFSEGDFPYTTKISAKDFTRLEQFTFPLSDQRVPIVETIASILSNLDLGLGIKTYTNWTHIEITRDFLVDIYHEQKQLRDFGKLGDGVDFDQDDKAILSNEALELILKSFGLILRQSEGYYRLFHLSSLSDSTSIEYEYDSSGAYVSNQTVDLSATVDKENRYILPQSKSVFNAGLKRASAVLVHNTVQSEIKFDATLDITGEGNITKTQFFNANGKQSFTFKTIVSAATTNTDGAAFTNPRATVRIFVDGATNYYLNADGSWTTTPAELTIKLPDFVPRGAGVTAEDATIYRGSFDIVSDTVPELADGNLTIELNNAVHGNDTDFGTTQYSTTQFEISSTDEAEDSVDIAYEMVSDDNFSRSYNHGTISFADGVTPYSPSALRYGEGDSDLTDGGWSFIGGSQNDGIHQLLLKEILYMQSKATRNLSADLYGFFSGYKVLIYDSKRFFFLGGTLNADNVWKGDFLELNFLDVTTSLQELFGKKGSSFTGGTSNSFDSFWENIKQSQFFNTVFLSNFIGELSEPIEANTEITSFTADLFADIAEGEDFILVDKENEKPYHINIIGEYNTGQSVNVTIDEQFISTDLPAGTPIVMSGGLLQSYFKVDPTKLLISVQSRDESFFYGKLNEDISGGVTKTTLDLVNANVNASNPAIFTDDQALRFRREDGESQVIRVDGDQSFTSSTFTLNVQSFETDFLAFGASIPQFAKYKAYIEPINEGSSIEFLKGRLILSADGSGGLAQIRLDGRGSSSSITLDADNINVIGQTTFTSGLVGEGIETQSGAQSKANSAQSAAEAYAAGLVAGLTVDELAIKNEMAQALGFADFASIVASAVQNSTLIVGGYIDTTLINTDAIFANNLVISSSGSIQSSTYNQGVDGFKINADGSAEFNDIALRTGNYSVQTSGVEIDGNDLNVNGTVTVGNAEVTGTAGTLVIQNPEVGTRSTNAGGSGDDTALQFTSTAFQPRMTARASNSFILEHRNVQYLNGSNDEYGSSINFVTVSNSSTVAVNGIGGANLTFDVNGTLTKNAGSFKIDHPLKPDTHHLVHSFTESPQADLIYRGKAVLNAGTATINIDETVGMTAGTFEALCRNVQVFTSNESSWDRVRGRVEGANVIIECEDPTCQDEISWLVIGERKDQAIYDSSMTDDNGKVILEPEKQQETQEQ